MKLFVALCAGWLWVSVSYAGVFIVNGNINTANSGLVLTATAGGTVNVNSGTGINIAGGSELTITGFTLSYGKRWQQVKVSASGGTVNVTVSDYLNNVLINNQAVTGSATFSIEKFDAAKNGKSLSVKITGLNTANLTDLQLSYSGNNTFYAYPSPFVPRKQTLKFAYEQPNDAQVTLQVFDQAGRLVKTIIDNQIRNARPSPIADAPTWDGTDNNGQYVASGVYLAYVKVKFVNSNNYSSSDIGDYTQSFRLVVYR